MLVELKYTLPERILEGVGGWTTRWLPPVPRGRTSIDAVRWQVALATRSSPISLGESSVEERWTFRNGMMQLTSAYTFNDLERWVSEGHEPDGSDKPASWDAFHASISARQTTLAPLSIVAFPKSLWFFVLSLIALGTILLLANMVKPGLGLAITLLAATVLVANSVWPQVAAQAIVGMQPGFALGIAIIGARRLVQWRHRRRLDRMPGFTRVHTESALVRSNGKRLIRETSTVDSPRVN